MHISGPNSSVVLNTFDASLKWHEYRARTRCKVEIGLDARRLSPRWGTSNWISPRRIDVPLALAGQLHLGAGLFVAPPRPSPQALSNCAFPPLRIDGQSATA